MVPPVLGGDMKRRKFITLLGGAAAVWPGAVRAQQPTTPVIGYLGLTTAQSNAYVLAPFRKSLSELGFDEGRNVNFEYRFAERDVSRLPALGADLVDRKVTVIFTDTTMSALAIKAATSSIPIVFAIGSDPVKSGLVTSLNRPGGNVTGVSFFTNQMEAKRLGLLHEVAPRAELIAALLNGNNPFVDNQTKDLEEASLALGLKLLIGRAGNEHEITNAFTMFAQQRAGALLVGADPYFNSQRALVIAPALQLGLPAIYEWREFTEAGGLMSYGTSLTDAYRHASDLVARILKGAQPADLPVLQMTKFEFVINLKTAKTLGVKISDNLLSLADEVIE
jgi:putative tryptophan/tyrosine transport system substrate-binding protein